MLDMEGDVGRIEALRQFSNRDCVASCFSLLRGIDAATHLDDGFAGARSRATITGSTSAGPMVSLRGRRLKRY